MKNEATFLVDMMYSGSFFFSLEGYVIFISHALLCCLPIALYVIYN